MTSQVPLPGGAHPLCPQAWTTPKPSTRHLSATGPGTSLSFFTDPEVFLERRPCPGKGLPPSPSGRPWRGRVTGSPWPQVSGNPHFVLVLPGALSPHSSEGQRKGPGSDVGIRLPQFTPVQCWLRMGQPGGALLPDHRPAGPVQWTAHTGAPSPEPAMDAEGHAQAQHLGISSRGLAGLEGRALLA